VTSGWQQSDPTAQAVKNSKGYAGGHQEKNQDAESTWAEWFMKDAAGASTFGMLVVTIIQAGLFFVQLKFMVDGLGDSSKAANAATVAGREARTANRPFLVHKLALRDVSIGNEIEADTVEV
jgi:hypothetical protein